jgi:FAD/FMN-containing dehydrogenase
VNTIDRILTCEAGCITAQVQRTAEKNGLLFPMNFGSAGSSHIGGNAATNAGGLNVIRYGLTRSWIAGLVVVTGRGEVLELNANLMKNATGYDLKQLFIGSEGTLGIITEVSVRLTVRPSSARVMLLALTGTAVILPVLSHLRTHLELTAFEVFPDAAIQAVSETSGLRHPFGDIRSDTYLLVEFETGDNGDEEALSCFQTLVNETLVDDGILAESSEDAKRLWSFRERIPESLAWRHPYRNDISVKPSQVPDFLIDIEEYLGSQKPKPGFIWYGHVGDGNVHLNILRPDSISVDDFKNLCVAIRTGIAHIVSQYRGSVSAEHGIGLLKKPILEFSRSEQEIEYMRGIKSVFDPAGIMNPGKIFD